MCSSHIKKFSPDLLLFRTTIDSSRQIFAPHATIAGAFWKGISPLFIYVGKEKNEIRRQRAYFLKIPMRLNPIGSFQT